MTLNPPKNVTGSDTELLEQNARLKAIVETVLSGIITINYVGQIETFNTAAQDIFGYDASEVIGQNVRMLMPNPFHDEHDAYIKNYRDSGEPKIIGTGREVIGRRKDGTEFPMDLAVSEMQLDGKQMFTGIVRDITEIRNLEESQQRLAHITQVMPEALIVVDLDGKITDWNPAAETMFGYSKDEILGRPTSTIHVPQTIASYRDQIAYALKTAGEYFGEMQCIRKDGTRISVELSAITLKGFDGSIIGNIGINRNVTERRLAADQILRAKEEAEAANRAKSDFLSSMSHELRTPLNAILGFSQLLQTDPEYPLASDQNESVQHILKGGRHLLTLIDEVLDLAKIEEGSVGLSIEDVEVAPILLDCLETLQPLADEAGIKIRGETHEAPSICVRADRTRLKQVLINLLSNAIKYNTSGGSVIISYGPNVGPTGLRINITDTGPGIKENQRKQVFQPFDRLGREAGDTEGTGIGLTITKRLIEVMGGSIDFESEVGKGSTFWIELPMTVAADRNSVSDGSIDTELGPANTVASGGAKTVLYVEDNPANLRLMERIIGRLPAYTLISTHTAELGLDLARQHQPSIIILDINLPDMSGLEALAHLHKSPETKDIPVIALSANAMPGQVQKGLEGGFRYYLTKPINISELVEALTVVSGE